MLGAQGRIRTGGFTVLQTVALGLSATCALYLATPDGFEPPTFGFGDQRSARLNYRAIIGGNGEIRTHGRFLVASFQD